MSELEPGRSSPIIMELDSTSYPSSNRHASQDNDEIEIVAELPPPDIIYVSTIKRSRATHHHPACMKYSKLKKQRIEASPPPEPKPDPIFRFITCALCQEIFSKISNVIATRCGHSYCMDCFSYIKKAKKLCVGVGCKKKLTVRNTYRGYPN